MKKLFFSALLLFIFFNLSAQDVQSKIYDKKGRLIQRNRVNFKGKLEQDIYGIASMKYEYDKKDNLIRKSYFDKLGKPYVPDTVKRELPVYPSFSLYKYVDGNLVQITNHNASGGFIDLNGHPAIRVFKYNVKGLKAEEATYDKKGKPLGMGGLDIAIQRFTYNSRNQLTEERSYDHNNKLLDFGMNIASHSYDREGRKIRTDYFFANSSLFHTDKFYYDDKGHMIKEDSYNKNGKLEYSLLCTYNGDQLYKKEYKYTDKTTVQKQGFELAVQGWKIISAPNININDLDATGSLLITIDDKGNITEIKNSSCKVQLTYAIYPLIKQIKLARDESEKAPLHKGELRVGVLNINAGVDEF